VLPLRPIRQGLALQQGKQEQDAPGDREAYPRHEKGGNILYGVITRYVRGAPDEVYRRKSSVNPQALVGFCLHVRFVGAKVGFFSKTHSHAHYFTFSFFFENSILFKKIFFNSIYCKTTLYIKFFSKKWFFKKINRAKILVLFNNIISLVQQK
jgi:hypothetical protein